MVTMNKTYRLSLNVSSTTIIPSCYRSRIPATAFAQHNQFILARSSIAPIVWAISKASSGRMTTGRIIVAASRPNAFLAMSSQVVARSANDVFAACISPMPLRKDAQSNSNPALVARRDSSSRRCRAIAQKQATITPPHRKAATAPMYAPIMPL